MKIKYFLCLIAIFFVYYVGANAETAVVNQPIKYTKSLPIPGIIMPDAQAVPPATVAPPVPPTAPVSPAPVVPSPPPAVTDNVSAPTETIIVNEEQQTSQAVSQEQPAVVAAENQQSTISNEEILTNLAAEDLSTLIALLSDSARIEELKNNLTLLQKAGATGDQAVSAAEAQVIAGVPKSFTEQIKASVEKLYSAVIKLPSSKIVRNEIKPDSLTTLSHVVIIFTGLAVLWWVATKLINLLQIYFSRRQKQTFSAQLLYGSLTFLPIAIIWAVAAFILPYISLLRPVAVESVGILLPSIIVVLLLDNTIKILFSLRFRGIRILPTNRYINRLVVKYLRKLVWMPLTLFLLVYVLRRLPNQPVLEVRTVLQLCAGLVFLFGLYQFITVLKQLIERYYKVKRASMIQNQFIWLYDWLTHAWHYLVISYLIIIGVYWFSDFAYRRFWLLENTIGLIFIVIIAFTIWRFIYCFTYNFRKPLSKLNIMLLKSIIIATALFVILRNLGFDISEWLKGEQGELILVRAITLTILFIFWYIISTILSSVVSKYLTTTDEEGSLINDNGRLRTVLPLIKNVILISISLVFILIALASFNVNIMPLLAGAGVVGIAIGFGSQKLVADFITGIFNLIEDTMQVGDVVQINDLSGTVDNLSVRSVRLRDASGNVHTIPFSAVEQVSNLTREFSFAVIDIGVSYNENIDYVFEVLSDIGKEMQDDQPWSFYIVEELEIFGLDSFGDSSVNIRARFKTRPGKQFGVRREFNRRIKNTFDAKGIQIPYPHLTVYRGDQPSDSPSPKKEASKEVPIAVIDEEQNQDDED